MEKKQFNSTQNESFSGKLSFWKKFIYGLGRGNEGLTYAVLGTFFLFYLTDVVKISPIAASLVVMIPRLWDAINNPIMGIISDRTRSKWGRRIPYIAWGTIPTSVFFCLLWIPITFSNATVTVWYYGFIFFMFTTAATVVTVPYYSLGIEMTTDYNERTSISNIRELIGMAFSCVAAVIPLMIITSMSDAGKGYSMMGISMALVSGLVVLPLVFKVKERAVLEKPQKKYGIKEMLLPLIKNKPFRWVNVIYFVYKLGCITLESFIIYYVTYWLGRTDMIMSAFAVALCGGWAVATPFFSRIVKRKGKRFAHILSLVAWIIGFVPFVFYPQTVPIWIPLLTFFIGGMGWGSNHILPASMLADVADLDELVTGQRREGLLYGTWSMVGKIATAIGLLPVMFILQKAGYTGGSVQPASALNAIRMIMAFGNTLYLAIGIFATIKYDLNKKRHNEIRQKIDARNAVNAAEM